MTIFDKWGYNWHRQFMSDGWLWDWLNTHFEPKGPLLHLMVLISFHKYANILCIQDQVISFKIMDRVRVLHFYGNHTYSFECQWSISMLFVWRKKTTHHTLYLIQKYLIRILFIDISALRKFYGRYNNPVCKFSLWLS